MPPIAEDPELIQAFLVESEELLQAVDQDLVKLESAPTDEELLNRTFRALHTIKGTASSLGFDPIVRVGHSAEDVLSGVREGRLRLTPRVMDALLAARDQLGTMLEDLRAGGLKEYALSALLVELEQVQSGMSPAVPAVNQEPMPAQEALVSATTRADDVGAGNRPSAASPHAAIQSLRVDVRKLDELIAMIGELVLERNRLLRLTKEMGSGRVPDHDTDSPLTNCALRLSFITEELQAAGLRTRMVPIETVFAKFPRMVRDIAHSLGKEPELVLHGQETEIDKTMVELVSDPLVHLVRNSLDHGLELRAVREQAGKPCRGVIRLQAEHEGDHVLIRISDDGAGINSERVLKKAIEKGFVTAEQSSRLTTKEVYEFIFLPGFSTVENATDISGRGVGMDVVRSNLKKINGGCGAFVATGGCRMIAAAAAAPIARAQFTASPALMQVRDLIYKTAGIFQSNNRLRFLDDQCQKRMQALGLRTMRDYFDCLTNKPMARGELSSLLNEITIGETFFFRNQPQLDGIRNVVLPRVMEAKSRIHMRHLRIWSAGCSTGEEPYTRAIILLEESKSRLKEWTFEVLATDLNQRSLAAAEVGSYGEYSVP